LAEEVQQRNIRSIAVPPLGCGNGGLDWQSVLPCIKAALEPLANVRVLVFTPETDALHAA
jgi:O-acetyl-ADP-ribose deacetylase (regulator of RNase III)